MAQTQKFDKLNSLRSQAMPFEQYFGEMDLEDEEKERRIGFAEILDDMFFYYLAMLFEDMDNEAAIRKSLKTDFKSNIQNYFSDIILKEDYMNKYVDDVVDSIVDTTLSNASDTWYGSQDRATYIAEDETNAVSNYYQEREALINGKTTKIWRTILDGKERHSHFIANAQEIPIGDAFTVGNSKMMYPKDISLGAELKEIIGCRCSCFYS